VRAELGKTLSWRELIHTSYFDVPACARILAYGLNRAGLGQLSAEHWPEATRTETEAWLRHISTPPPAAATAGEGAPAPMGAVAGPPVGRMQEA
jgi:hypothetical protein